MKKARLFLMAALLIGIGSAFTTVKPMLSTVYATTDNGVTWRQLDTADYGTTYVCNSGSDFCTYSAEDINSPIGDKNQQIELLP